MTVNTQQNTIEVKTRKASQRRKNFNGGIKLGSSATSKRSRHMDNLCKMAAPIVLKQLKEKYPELRWVSEIVGTCDYVGMRPDGGLFYLNDRLVAAFEAKYQGITGNVVNRWYKNHLHILCEEPKASNLTFVTGAGAMENTRRNLNIALKFHKLSFDWNVLNIGSTSFFGQVDDYELDYIVQVMSDCIAKTIDALE